MMVDHAKIWFDFLGQKPHVTSTLNFNLSNYLKIH
jgi:hypothetical protein